LGFLATPQYIHNTFKPRQLFAGFFVHGFCPAPFAVLFKLNFTLHQFFIFGAPVVYPLALLAGEFNQSLL
jgi:hypothetical protein